MHARLFALAVLIGGNALAVPVTVRDPGGKPIATVMVSRQPVKPAEVDTSDNGYPASGKPQQAFIELARFTDAAGQTDIPPADHAWKIRLRRPGYQDLTVASDALDKPLVMKPETDPAALAAQQPANAWSSTIDFGDANLKKEFMLQCNFCHQQGGIMLRRDRSAEEWDVAIKRMVRYGSRLSSADQKALPELLSSGWRTLREHPERIAEPAAWDAALAGSTLTEWPIGDAMSQQHDQLLGRDGHVYVADNIQDRVWEVDPASNRVTVHKIPHREGEPPGGLLAARLKEFPRHDSTSNAHSLAQSERDGHIFITPSAQQRLVEFDPASGAFTLHDIGGGFYPHTIRVDAQDRVWFTLALSNQVAMFERSTRRFTLYDLPARGLRERLTVALIKPIFKLMSWGVPLSNWLPVDRLSTGVPLPYGIAVTPDGSVWVSRLHADDLARIDPKSGAVTMVPVPFAGPRRLRSDADGNLWITAFPESAIYRYEPATQRFTRFELPVLPKGSETPYALNVDKRRGIVWVNGNQSDSLYALEIASGTWRRVPLPRRVAFTRDIEIAADGTVYTSTSSFPSWHVEDGQPTLIRVQTKAP